ncbi:ABC transporter ATP-binding protein [Cryptosporangium aurantiacum]|uniref:Amino acid/amide ABC transporter ATP-binding protein 2, HAAT family n=1 Tax=Cryptosporangium aurantiacum TaxID=134849 RepID=A0A1M7R1A0_9ACTN|nr:ABC transporter ATP-binding protein [Cryptosporangium aurantiacum]SHN38194.1 amino acid/amide ABC transporter ATP-binding protein 2, HAAT family [Cryptosporangium aurantiacum]
MTALHVRGLVSGYARSAVLNGVDLDVDEGGALALLGRNGVGKSTLISTLMGLVPVTSGSIRLGERELAGSRTDVIARAGVALVPQGRRVWPPLTVREHLHLAGSRRRGSWTVDAVLDLLPQLGERLSHPAAHLSGGEQQMLVIGRALLTNPSLLLLDEPSDGLAPAIVEQVGAVLRTVRQEGVTVLLVEQNLRLAFTVGERIAVMEKGRIVHQVPTRQFRSEPDTARRLLGVAG